MATAARTPAPDDSLHLIGQSVLLVAGRPLARSTRDLLNILDKIGKAGTQFRSLHATWTDTRTPRPPDGYDHR